MGEQKSIKVGDQTVTGILCPICPGHMVIFPESAAIEHEKRHGAIEHRAWSRNPHGRPPGRKREEELSIKISSGRHYRR